MQKILLNRHSKYSEVAALNVDDLNYSIKERENKFKTSGNFSIVNDEMIALYAHRGDLFLMAGSVNTKLSGTESADYTRENETASVDVKDGAGKTILSFSLQPIGPSLHPYEDWTAASEAEDFDFALFIHNMINDAERLEMLRRRG